MIILHVFLIVAISCPINLKSRNTKIMRIDGHATKICQIEDSIVQIMEKAGIPGISCAIINDSQIVYEQGFGLRKKDSTLTSDKYTIFNAASFSKTVFAYLVMLLSEDGIIDLDKPLQEYLEKPLYEYPNYQDLIGDSRASLITARMVLSHQTGFPNLRFLTKDGKLKFLFEPGTGFSYSGEGIGLLQMVIEEITGIGLEELCKERIFEPFDMNYTSYVWQERFEENHAFPHDQYERPRPVQRRHKADAIGSMLTTAGDYARFLVGLLNSKGERRNLISSMFEPQIAITSKSKFGPGAWEDTDKYTNIRLSRTLGWGYFKSHFGRAVFHTGHDLGNQNYHVVFLDKGIGAVLLSNSDNFESAARELFEAIIGDTISPFDWLGYPYYDPDKNRTPPPEPVAIELEPEVLHKFVGEYTFPGNRTLTIKFDEQNLIISDDGERWLPLSAEAQDKFFVKGREYEFQFLIDETGIVTGYKLLIEDVEIPGEKIK